MRWPGLVLVSVAAVGAAALASCDVYDPTLPGDPFLCGASDPKCPDGYIAIDETPTRCVCHKPGQEAPDAGDGCLDEYEPNETYMTAYMTSIGNGSNSETVFPAKTCPGTDVDVYQVGTMRDQMVSAICDYMETVGLITMDVLNSAGSPVVVGMEMGNGVLRASLTSDYDGFYYVRVESASGAEVPYGCTLTVSGP